MGKRIAISARRRFEVFKRDEFTCQYCGAHPPHVILHCDHVVSVADGGDNDECNLITACERCNLGKGAVSLARKSMSLDRRASIEVERESQVSGYEAVMRAKHERIERQKQEIVDLFCNEYIRDYIPKKHAHSIKFFIEKLGFNATRGAVEIACSRVTGSYNRAFLYFCGVCWNKVRELGDHG